MIEGIQQDRINAEVAARFWLTVTRSRGRPGYVPEGGFKTIICDCPWRYRNWSDKAHGSHKPHYDGMTYDAMERIPVGHWAADGAVLLMWGTWPKADQAIDLLRAWSFSYVTGFPWVKTMPSTESIARGVGFWSMACSEYVVIGRRGKPKVTRPESNVLGLLCGSERVFYSPRPRGGDHSNKPYDLHEYAEERLEGPYLEMFARERRDGWTTWGNELGHHLSGDGMTPIDAARERGLVERDAATDEGSDGRNVLHPALEGF